MFAHGLAFPKQRSGGRLFPHGAGIADGNGRVGVAEIAETLWERDRRAVDAAGEIRSADYLREAGRQSGRNPISLAMEYIKLARGPGRITLPEYVQFGLYDPALSDSDRRRFVSESIVESIVRSCSDTRWWATVWDRWLIDRILAGIGVLMPQTLAVIDRGPRAYPGTRVIRTSSELSEFVCAHLDAGGSIFGKELWSQRGFGTFLIREADSDRVRLEGEGWFGYERFVETLVGPLAYQLQPVERNHPFLERYTTSLATVRICVLLTRAGPRIPFTVLKVPGMANVTDHFWRKGNLACEVDPGTGVIVRARSYHPFGTMEHTDHPETGARIVGETLPFWDDALALARSCSRVFAPIRYQAMDVAITPSGPMLIEINVHGSISFLQLSTGRGFLSDDVSEFLAECGHVFDRRRRWRRSRGAPGR